MSIPFSKYSGAGNTFCFVDNREAIFTSHFSNIPLLCKEHSVDGCILLENSKKADYRMRIFNPDGSEAEMCGNGLRSLILFLEELGVSQPSYKIETGASEKMGALLCKRLGKEILTSMGDPHSYQWNLNLISSNQVPIQLHFLNTGVPHAVHFLNSNLELASYPVFERGAALRYHPYFSPKGTNVNFVAREGQTLSVRTYERGVENETLACGTGAVASALSAAFTFGISSPIQVNVRSKDQLTVHFKKKLDLFSEVFLQGPAKKIGEGKLYI